MCDWVTHHPLWRNSSVISCSFPFYSYFPPNLMLCIKVASISLKSLVFHNCWFHSEHENNQEKMQVGINSLFRGMHKSPGCKMINTVTKFDIWYCVCLFVYPTEQWILLLLWKFIHADEMQPTYNEALSKLRLRLGTVPGILISLIGIYRDTQQLSDLLDSCVWCT